MAARPLNSIWKCTESAREFNPDTGMIIAELFDGTNAHSYWILVGFSPTGEELINAGGELQPTEVMVTLKAQSRPVHGGELVRIPLDTWNTYETNGWIIRVDMPSPQEVFPIYSMWKITDQGQANVDRMLGPFTTRADTIWMVHSILADPGTCMRQRILLLNITRAKQLQIPLDTQTPTRELRRLCLHAMNLYRIMGWIERVDVAGMDLDMHYNGYTENQYLIGANYCTS